MNASPHHRIIAILTLIGWGLFPLPSLIAQDAITDFQKINRAYQQHPNLFIDMEYRLYPNFSTDEAHQSQKSEVKKQGQKIFYKIGHTETLTTEKYYIMVDHEDKLIVVDKLRKTISPPLIVADIEATLALCHTVEFVRLSDRLQGYRLGINLPEYERIDIYFDPKSFFIEKMVLYHRIPIKLREKAAIAAKPRIEMSYQSIETAPDFEKNKFSESQYLLSDRQPLTLNAQYKGYQLVDYTLH